MNFGTFEGVDSGAVTADTVTKYVQTPTILSSQTIQVPSGVKRIEALLCGGGGAGLYSGGGFGGLAVIEIPITGQPLQVVIGAGGTNPYTTATAGSPTYIVSAGTRYAEVGGGGGVGSGQTHGRSGGGGAGPNPAQDAITPGGNGGAPPIGKLLWTLYPQDNSNTATKANVNSAPSGAGSGSRASGTNATNGAFGGGGGGGIGSGTGANATNGGYGGGGGSIAFQRTGLGGNGSLGGGGGLSQAGQTSGSGGSLTSVSIWGYTGKGAGDVSQGWTGGGGMLTAATASHDGGLGGGGAGGGAGDGGAGFAAIRFYF